MDVPEDLRYSENDEWLRIEGELAVIGITDYAQDQLSDVVYVEVSEAAGTTLDAGQAFGVVESVKAAADVYMPVSGEIVEINEALADQPEQINSDPYGAAWMIKIKMSSADDLDKLMDADAYRSYLETR